jgi:hypothetical protein
MGCVGAAPGWQRRALDVACATALVAFLLWSVVGEAVRTGGLGDEALDDLAIARARSVQILERRGYAWQLDGVGPAVVFAYPPPSVVGHAALAGAGPILGPVAFMAALVGACWAGARAAVGLLGLRAPGRRWLPVLLAVAACRVFVQTDLHFLNTNLLATAGAVGALAAWGPTPRRPSAEALGGLLLSASVAVKPWAVAIVAMPLAQRRAGALAWAAVAGVALFAWAPACAIGADDTIALTASWLAFLPETLGPTAVGRVAADHVSLFAAASALGLDEQAATVVARAGKGAWVLGVGTLVFGALRSRAAGAARDGRAWLRTGATLLVLPVPLSGMLQIHHLAVAAPLALVVAADACDVGRARAGRVGRLVVLAGVFGLSTYGPGGAARGLIGLACLVALVSAAWWPEADRAGDGRSGGAFHLPEASRPL